MKFKHIIISISIFVIIVLLTLIGLYMKSKSNNIIETDYIDKTDADERKEESNTNEVVSQEDEEIKTMIENEITNTNENVENEQVKQELDGSKIENTNSKSKKEATSDKSNSNGNASTSNSSNSKKESNSTSSKSDSDSDSLGVYDRIEPGTSWNTEKYYGGEIHQGTDGTSSAYWENTNTVDF